MGSTKKTSSVMLLSLSIIFVLLGIYSFLIEPNMTTTNMVTIASDELHASFHDKKVVHISDLHITSIGRREERLIATLNGIRPDILFITGDLTTYGQNEDLCVEVLRRIHRPTYGIWAVLGNTDKYKGEGNKKDIGLFVKKLRDAGIKVLRNDHERLALNEKGDHLFIVGVEGPYLSRARLNWLLRDVPDGSKVIILSHYPDILQQHPDALTVNLGEEDGIHHSGWGWQDNAFFEHDSGIVRFEKDGKHTLRVQRREDGVSIEQICLVAGTNGRSQACTAEKSGSGLYDAINPGQNEMIVIKAGDIPASRIFGSWKKVNDQTSDFKQVIKDISDSENKVGAPVADPDNYFEVDFYAKANVDYHVWLRMKATNSSISSDSVYLQFSNSVGPEGQAIYRIGEKGRRNRMERIDLILAGHTHGGQIRFPIIGALDIVPYHELIYDMGLFEEQGTRMYVNRGLGTTAVPARFLSVPEITEFAFTKEGA